MPDPRTSPFLRTIYPVSMGVVFLIAGLFGLYWTFAFTLGVFQIRHALEPGFTYTGMDVVMHTLRHRGVMLLASLATLVAAIGLLRRHAWGRRWALALLVLALVYVPTSFAVDMWRLHHEDPGMDRALYGALMAQIGWAYFAVGFVCLLLAVLAWLMARVPWRRATRDAVRDGTGTAPPDP